MHTGSFGKMAAVALFGLVAASWSNAAVTLGLPNVNANPGDSVNLTATFTADAGETLTTDGYVLMMTVTGPSDSVTLGNLTGVMSPFTSTAAPAFFAADPVNGPASAGNMYTDVYFGNGGATIQNGAIFGTFTAGVAADAAPGIYNVDFYVVPDAYQSMFTDSAAGPDPLSVAFSGGTITVASVPEPTSLLFVGGFTAFIVTRRRVK